MLLGYNPARNIFRTLCQFRGYPALAVQYLIRERQGYPEFACGGRLAACPRNKTTKFNVYAFHRANIRLKRIPCQDGLAKWACYIYNKQHATKDRGLY